MFVLSHSLSRSLHSRSSQPKVGLHNEPEIRRHVIGCSLWRLGNLIQTLWSNISMFSIPFLWGAPGTRVEESHEFHMIHMIHGDSRHLCRLLRFEMLLLLCVIVFYIYIWFKWIFRVDSFSHLIHEFLCDSFHLIHWRSDVVYEVIQAFGDVSVSKDPFDFHIWFAYIYIYVNIIFLKLCFFFLCDFF